MQKIKNQYLNKGNRISKPVEKNNPIKIIDSIYTFYRDGFKGMTLGKKLWKIILIKLFVMFVILKLFFFPNFLDTKFHTDEEKGNYVLEQITGNASPGNIK
jgi:hypothetical protein